MKNFTLIFVLLSLFISINMIANANSNLAPPPTNTDSLVITEIMYNGPESKTDTTEFIEIYNNGSTTVDLTDYKISQGVEYTFPSVNINAGEYIVICENSSAFKNTFGFTALQWTKGSLKNSGEAIVLVNDQGDIVDSVKYDDGNGWPEKADGGGSSLTLCNADDDNNIGSSWSASINFIDTNAAGNSIWASPGAGCPTAPDLTAPIVLSAAATSETAILVVFDEKLNSETATDIANYTGITGLSTATLSANFMEVELYFTTALISTQEYTLTINNVKDLAMNMMDNPQSFNLIFNNSVANIVISEIMYNDLSKIDSLEYLEIYNNDNTAANISGYAITDGISYTFPKNTIIAAGEYLVIAKNASLVNSVFSIKGTHEWTSGGLKNSGESIKIENTNGNIIDLVDYMDENPWPTEADGDGPSLELCDKNTDNNNGTNWSLAKKLAGIFMGDSIFGTPGEGCFIDAINSNSKNTIMVNIYPNPASDILNIKTTAKSLQIDIYNIQGSLQISQTINNNQQHININNLNNGIYFVRIIDNKTGNQNTKKLIIQ